MATLSVFSSPRHALAVVWGTFRRMNGDTLGVFITLTRSRCGVGHISDVRRPSTSMHPVHTMSNPRSVRRTSKSMYFFLFISFFFLFFFLPSFLPSFLPLSVFLSFFFLSKRPQRSLTHCSRGGGDVLCNSTGRTTTTKKKKNTGACFPPTPPLRARCGGPGGHSFTGRAADRAHNKKKKHAFPLPFSMVRLPFVFPSLSDILFFRFFILLEM